MFHVPGLAGCTEPLHINRWITAMVAGRKAKYPKCARILRNGERCRNSRFPEPVYAIATSVVRPVSPGTANANANCA